MPKWTCTSSTDTTDDALELLVAYDSKGRYSKEADNSILVRIVDEKVSVLLTGDCEERCEKEIINTSQVQSHILNVGHHGSSAASSLAFLQKVKPKIAIIQAGVNNQYHHPKPDVLLRLRMVGVFLYRTDRDGTIVALSDGKQVKIETDEHE